METFAKVNGIAVIAQNCAMWNCNRLRKFNFLYLFRASFGRRVARDFETVIRK